MSLAAVDELLGFGGDSDDEALPAPELVDRFASLVAAAVRFMRQLPPEHYDDLTPGMTREKGPVTLSDGTPLFLPNGKAFVPHQTYLGLARHIVAHAVKHQHLIGPPANTAALESVEVYGPLGEPDEGLDVAALIEIAERAVLDVRRWSEGETAARDLSRVLETFWGQETLHKVLHRNTYSLAQHTRQLMSVLKMLDIVPDGPLRERDFKGISLPARLWD